MDEQSDIRGVEEYSYQDARCSTSTCKRIKIHAVQTLSTEMMIRAMSAASFKSIRRSWNIFLPPYDENVP